jgi:hypothetical protein
MAEQTTEIECRFRPTEKFESVFGERGEKKKLGSYHGSYFWEVEGFATKRWAIGATIEGDFGEYKDLEEEELVAACVSFLNRPVGKRKKKQPYGCLEVLRHTLREDGTIRVLLLTDHKKNKNFWGKGQTIPQRFRTKSS